MGWLLYGAGFISGVLYVIAVRAWRQTRAELASRKKEDA